MLNNYIYGRVTRKTFTKMILTCIMRGILYCLKVLASDSVTKTSFNGLREMIACTIANLKVQVGKIWRCKFLHVLKSDK